MSKIEPAFNIFPHEQRIDQVQKNGKIYFRSYVPNFVSGIEPAHYFFDSIEDLCQFIREEYSDFNFVERFELCKRDWTNNYNEWLLISYEKSGAHWVLGFCNNLENAVIDNQLRNSGIPITITEE